jgi:hypothetical protein
MKRWVFLGLMLVAVSSFVLGSTTVSKNAETSPPDPAGMIVSNT